MKYRRGNVSLESLEIRQLLSATVGVNARVPWNDSGIYLDAGQTYTISASGQVDVGSFASSAFDLEGCGGSTYEGALAALNPSSSFAAPGLPAFSLIGCIGSAGAGNPFEIGAGGTFVAAQSGELYLGINDFNYADNSGSFSARISAERLVLPAPTDLEVTPDINGGLDLTYDATTDANAYNIYRSSSPNFYNARLVASNFAGTDYDDRFASPGRNYYYWVQPIDGTDRGQISDGVSGYVNEVVSSGATVDGYTITFPATVSVVNHGISTDGTLLLSINSIFPTIGAGSGQSVTFTQTSSDAAPQIAVIGAKLTNTSGSSIGGVVFSLSNSSFGGGSGGAGMGSGAASFSGSSFSSINPFAHTLQLNDTTVEAGGGFGKTDTRGLLNSGKAANFSAGPFDSELDALLIDPNLASSGTGETFTLTTTGYAGTSLSLTNSNSAAASGKLLLQPAPLASLISLRNHTGVWLGITLTGSLSSSDVSVYNPTGANTLDSDLTSSGLIQPHSALIYQAGFSAAGQTADFTFSETTAALAANLLRRLGPTLFDRPLTTRQIIENATTFSQIPAVAAALAAFAPFPSTTSAASADAATAISDIAAIAGNATEEAELAQVIGVPLRRVEHLFSNTAKATARLGKLSARLSDDIDAAIAAIGAAAPATVATASAR